MGECGLCFFFFFWLIFLEEYNIQPQFLFQALDQKHFCFVYIVFCVQDKNKHQIFFIIFEILWKFKIQNKNSTQYFFLHLFEN